MNILEVKNISKTLKKKQILKGISFSVKKGEIYGFLGLNGSGKTTTMKCILNFLHPDSGEIQIFGNKGLTIEDKKNIGFMPENTYLYKHLTGGEFLDFHLKFFTYSKEKRQNKINELLKKVGLETSRNTYLKYYSKGMLQRIGLAQALGNQPKLLFLDEPTSGLDPIGRKMMKDIILDLQKKGTTIFLNTHILADVENICDKISIIHQGEIIVEGQKISEIPIKLEDFFIQNIGKYTDL